MGQIHLVVVTGTGHHSSEYNGNCSALFKQNKIKIFRKTLKTQTFLRSFRLNSETELTEGKEIASTLPKLLPFDSVKEKQ